ncbi:MAG: acylphosphatase [Parachlamydiaceae bacterium]|nr:acylphosphatase [Parachlamydiaceae bacterium]
MMEMHAIVSGQVQGVGFRATVCYQATKLDLTGTVSNLSNGSVELYAQGSKQQLETLLQNIRKNSGLGYIESITTDFYKPSQNYEHFSILYSRSP